MTSEICETPKAEVLLSFCPEDVDSVIPEGATDEQREDCYEAIRNIDCSSIFDHFSIVVEMALRGDR